MRDILKTTVVISILCAVLSACAASRYDDYRSLLKQELVLMRDFNAAAQKATDAAGLARAVRQLNRGLAGLKNTLKGFEAAHPELVELSQPPSEIQDEYDELGKSLGELDRVLINKEMFFEDPEVRAELEKLLDLQAELGM